MNQKNPQIDVYMENFPEWRKETEQLRAISLGCGLTEELKWNKPCYSYEGRNVVIIQGFKESCALLFCKGALLKDPKKILEKPGDNTQAALRIRFTDVQQIVKLAPVLKAYIAEAIAAEQAGLKVEFKRSPEPVPAELQSKLDANPALKTAFAALTPGRQRAYILHFSGAKQSATRTARIEKCVPQILRGKGLND
ncbi:MAG: YdeI/OmpD-associated family protein [Verrucomicrobia bacterium]|nr:YdeI/OmpD-associated family protein [Verrucomicrobiota bacterium]